MTTPKPTSAATAIINALEAKYEYESNALRDQLAVISAQPCLGTAAYIGCVLATAHRAESAAAELSIARHMHSTAQRN